MNPVVIGLGIKRGRTNEYADLQERRVRVADRRAPLRRPVGRRRWQRFAREHRARRWHRRQTPPPDTPAAVARSRMLDDLPLGVGLYRYRLPRSLGGTMTLHVQERCRRFAQPTWGGVGGRSAASRIGQPHPELVSTSVAEFDQVGINRDEGSGRPGGTFINRCSSLVATTSEPPRQFTNQAGSQIWLLCSVGTTSDQRSSRATPRSTPRSSGAFTFESEIQARAAVGSDIDAIPEHAAGCQNGIFAIGRSAQGTILALENVLVIPRQLDALVTPDRRAGAFFVEHIGAERLAGVDDLRESVVEADHLNEHLVEIARASLRRPRRQRRGTRPV